MILFFLWEEDKILWLPEKRETYTQKSVFGSDVPGVQQHRFLGAVREESLQIKEPGTPPFLSKKGNCWEINGEVGIFREVSQEFFSHRLKKTKEGESSGDPILSEKGAGEGGWFVFKRAHP